MSARRERRPAGVADVIVIGAGHSGLVMSHALSRLGIDHVVLERGEVANAWRTARWDSLRLLTPNWLSRLPGYRYAGPDPDGYMGAGEVADLKKSLAAPRPTANGAREGGVPGSPHAGTHDVRVHVRGRQAQGHVVRVVGHHPTGEVQLLELDHGPGERSLPGDVDAPELAAHASRAQPREIGMALPGSADPQVVGIQVAGGVRVLADLPRQVVVAVDDRVPGEQGPGLGEVRISGCEVGGHGCAG